MASPLRKNFLQRFALAGVAFTLCAVCVMGASGASETQHQIKLAVPGQKLSFSPESDSDLKKLKEEIDLFLGAEKHPSLDGLSKNQVRALEILRELAGESLATTESGERRAIELKISEVSAAFNNSFRSPVPRRFEFFASPWVFLRRIYSPVGIGTHLAANLPEKANVADPSRLDPVESTFWSPSSRIFEQDLYHGFGRSEFESLAGKLCTYAAPKESHGLNPGLEVEYQGETYKLKFGEVSSEPFVARIFSALGFHTDPTDFGNGIKIAYNRRILAEFNSRQSLTTRFTIFGFVPLYTLNLQPHYDPFRYISAAVLRNGQRWSGRELKNRLLLNSALERPELASENYRSDLEKELDYLVMVPANVQKKDHGAKNLGPWDFGQMAHAERRELRGAGLLGAWLGWFDTRFDNTHLLLIKEKHKIKLEHEFSDLGGCLGQTSGLLFCRGEDPNSFPWTFTLPCSSSGSNTPRLRLEGYHPLAYSAAFAYMTLDDARWMARLIAQLKESQLVEALVASGFDSAQVRMYTEKLVSRRDRMLQDLGLADEIPLLRPKGVQRTFSYDPETDGPVTVTIPQLGVVSARNGPHRVVAGKLLPRD